MESSFARTTLCRKCGQHFSLERKAPPPVKLPEREPSLLKKLAGMIGRQRIRQICCNACQTRQEVSSSASSSLCQKCGAYIDLKDFKVATVFSRNIQTQGIIQVTPRGELTSTKSVCGEAHIQGKVHGTLICSGEVTVKFRGRLLGAIDAYKLIVEKKSDVEFVRPLKAHFAEIQGKVSARVIADNVTIAKGGHLEGTVFAKAITVEKGGIFQGELVIGKQELTQSELLPGAVPEGGSDLQTRFAI
jgi:cytoskeletal protein CcmA (bactofilin family)